MMRSAIVVLGMHRSGTSALAGALIAAGAGAPRTLMPATEDNALGYWESLPIVEFHDALLGRAGLSWDSWDVDIDERILTACGPEERAQLEALISSEFADSDLFLLKDPRLSLLLKLWLPLLQRLRIDARAVLLARSPVEVALSLKKRDGIDIDQSVLLWLRYNLLAERQTRRLPRCFADFDELLANASMISQRIAGQLGLRLAGLQDEQNLVRGTLRHQRSRDFSLIANGEVRAIAEEAWGAVQTMALRDTEDSRTTLDRLLLKLDQLMMAQKALRPQRYALASLQRLEQPDVKAFNVEAPLPGSVIFNRRIDLSGWLLESAPGGIDHLALWQGEICLGRATMNLARPDVAAAFETCEAADRSGFRVVASALPVDSDDYTISLCAVTKAASTPGRLTLAQLKFLRLDKPADTDWAEQATRRRLAGDREGALLALERAVLRLAAGDIPLHIRLAGEFRELQAFEAAEQLLQRILDRHPTHPGAAPALALLYRRKGAREQAAELFLKLAALYPKMPRLRLEASADLQALRRIPEALRHLDEFLLQEPAHFDARLRKAQLLRDAGEYAPAIALLRELVAENAQSVPALSGLMTALRAIECNEECAVIAERILAIQPENLAALGTRARLLELAGEQDAVPQLWAAAAARFPASAMHQLRYAEALSSAGHHHEAAHQWQLNVQRFPANADILVAAGLFARKINRRREAAFALRKALALSPERPRLNLECARELLHLGYPRRASRYLAREKARDPDIFETRLLLLRQLSPEAVEPRWRQALQSGEVVSKSEWFRIGLSLGLRPDEKEARSNSQDALGEAATIDGLLNRAESRFRAGEYEACRDALRQAFDLASSRGIQNRKQMDRLAGALHRHGLVEAYDALIRKIEAEAPHFLNDIQIIRQLVDSDRLEAAEQWRLAASRRLDAGYSERLQIDISTARCDFAAADARFQEQFAGARLLALPDLTDWVRLKMELECVGEANALLSRHEQQFHWADLVDLKADLARLDMRFEEEAALIERAVRRNSGNEAAASRLVRLLVESGRIEEARRLVCAWQPKAANRLNWMRLQILISFHAARDWDELLACIDEQIQGATAPDRQPLQSMKIHHLMLSARHEQADQELDASIAAIDGLATTYPQKCGRRLESANRLMQLARHEESREMLAALDANVPTSIWDPYHRTAAASGAYLGETDRFILHNQKLRKKRHRVEITPFSSLDQPVPGLRTAVFLHLYYLDLWPEIARYLDSLRGTDFALFISTSARNLEQARALLHERYPGAQLMATENRGFDVGSHWKTIATVDLRQFDVALLLQSKKSSHVRIGDAWRDNLMSSLLGSPQRWRENLQAFARDPGLGLLGCGYHRNAVDLLYCREMRATLRALGMPTEFDALRDCLEFVGGTILMIRANLLSEIQEKTVSAFEFEPYESLSLAKRRDSTYAHAIERALGFYVRWRGYHTLWRP